MFCAVVSALAPVMLPAGEIVGAVHVYIVLAGTISPFEVSGVIVKLFPLQIVIVKSLILGVSFTIISAVFEIISRHPPEENVMIQ